MPRFEYNIKLPALFKSIWVDGSVITVESENVYNSNPMPPRIINQAGSCPAAIPLGSQEDSVHRLCNLHGSNPAKLRPGLMSEHYHFQFPDTVTPHKFDCFIQAMLRYQADQGAREMKFQEFRVVMGSYVQKQHIAEHNSSKPYIPLSEIDAMKAAFNEFYQKHSRALQMQTDLCRRRVQCEEDFFCRNQEVIQTMQQTVREQAGVVVHTAALTVASELIERLLINRTKLDLYQIQHIMFGIQTLLLAATSATWSPVLLTTTIYSFMQYLEYAPTTSTATTSVLMIAGQVVKLTTSYDQFILSFIVAILTGISVRYLMTLLLGDKYSGKLKTE